MENASKALIIAGAILLSILLIGIGVYIYNMAAGTVKKANLNSQEVQQYNEPFENYGGEAVTGSQAIALCNLIRTHNLSHKTDLTQQILVEYNKDYSGTNASVAATEVDYTNEATTVKAQLRSGYTYKITFGYDPNSGLITAVGIMKK